MPARPTNKSPVVNWSLDQKESIKSAFFIGYVIMQVKLYFLRSCRSKTLRDQIFSFLCLQVPGGRLAEMFGTKRVFGINM